MAIEFARARFISRSKGGNAVRSAAYNARDTLESERTGERFSYQDQGTLAFHEIMLPEGASDRFADPSTLWNAAERAEGRKDSQVAREIVLALPADAEITDKDRIVLARSFAEENFVDKGLATQLDIHVPHSGDSQAVNHHAHLLVTTRRIEGDSFERLKFQDSSVRAINGRPIVTKAEQWGEVWAQHQDAYFRANGKGISVDPVAPVPGAHIGPKRFRHPQDLRITSNAQVREVNAKIARNPAAVAEHLGQRPFDGRALGRFLSKHIADPEERNEVQKKVRDLQHDALERASWADRGSLGQKLSVEDVARQLSPAYAKHLEEATALRRKADKADWVRNRQDVEKERADYRIEERWAKMSLVQKAAHLVGAKVRPVGALQDIELNLWSNEAGRADYTITKWSIRKQAYLADLDTADRLAKAELHEIRPPEKISLWQRAQAELQKRQKIALNARHALDKMASDDKLIARARRAHNHAQTL